MFWGQGRTHVISCQGHQNTLVAHLQHEPLKVLKISNSYPFLMIYITNLHLQKMKIDYVGGQKFLVCLLTDGALLFKNVLSEGQSFGKFLSRSNLTPQSTNALPFCHFYTCISSLPSYREPRLLQALPLSPPSLSLSLSRSLFPPSLPLNLPLL